MRKIRSHKFSAFTLMELMVGMLIAAIVSATAFTAYSFLFKQFEYYREGSENLEDIYEMTSLLREDVFGSDYLQQGETGWLLGFDSYEVYWHIDDSIVSRVVPWRSDTFSIVLDRYQLMWFKNPIGSGDAANQLDLFYRNNDIDLSSSFSKEYTSDQLMKITSYGKR